MASRARLAALAGVLAAALVVALAVGGNRSASKGATLPASGKTPVLPAQCLQVPSKIATPSWYPKDLPMPGGSFVSEVPQAQAGLRRVIFTVNGTLRDFVKHALTVWPKQGWRMGRGEAEPGEAEDNFIKTGSNRYGLFRAQSVYCDLNHTWVLMVLSDPSAATPSPTPTATKS